MRKKPTGEYNRFYRFLLDNLIDQQSLAKTLRCSRQAIYSYCKLGLPSYIIACAVSYVLGCKPEDVYSAEESRKARKRAL